MKKIALISKHFFTASALLMVACSEHPENKLKGEWVAEDKEHTLKVTNKTFTVDDEAQVTEDYFVRNDTIYTSFEGNQPYTKYTIKLLDDQQLTLLDPDSTLIKFKRK